MNAEETGAKKETNYLGKLSWFIVVICSTYLVSKISKAFNCMTFMLILLLFV